MRSINFIIPACLVTVREELVKRVEFARTVGNSLHLDVIAPNFVEKGTALPVDDWPLIDIEYAEAHLMVDDPLIYLSKLKAKGITRSIVHVESHFDLDELVAEARVNDIILGFAVNPETDLTTLRRFFAVSPYIQVMGVNPGRAGQAQLSHTALAVSYLQKQPSRLTITVDGGVNLDNIAALKKAGADFVVASAALYETGDWRENYLALIAKTKNDD